MSVWPLGAGAGSTHTVGPWGCWDGVLGQGARPPPTGGRSSGLRSGAEGSGRRRGLGLEGMPLELCFPVGSGWVPQGQTLVERVAALTGTSLALPPSYLSKGSCRKHSFQTMEATALDIR